MADNHTIDYALLRNAGTEKYFFETNKKIAYPEGEVVEWYGYRRHNFELEGCKGFIVEPPHPAPGLPWHWCTQWAEAFVPRTPALQLLERGFHHVHFNVFETYFNDEGIAKVEKFYAMLYPVTKIEGVGEDEAVVFLIDEENDQLVYVDDEDVIDGVYVEYCKMLEEQE